MLFYSHHLSHTSPGSGWSPHLSRATEHCEEEEEGFLPHPGPARFSGAEEVSEMAVRMSYGWSPYQVLQTWEEARSNLSSTS